MIEVGKTFLSDDIVEKHFVCDLNACKGACCVEGDLGAPLEKSELKELENNFEAIEPYLSDGGKAAIKSQGLYIYDTDDEFSTTTIGGKECAYAIYDENNILKCGIEQAHKDGKSTFLKPVSCHLYPIRITSYEEFDAVNYDIWDICSDACTLGQQLQLPIYKFVKEGLIRKYGEQWYKELCDVIEKKENQE